MAADLYFYIYRLLQALYEPREDCGGLRSNYFKLITIFGEIF